MFCFLLRYLSFTFVFLLFSISLSAQLTLRGKVIDAQTGEPISYANIVEKGSERGSTTGEDGTFELAVPALPVTLVATDIRYQSLEFQVTDPRPLIRLEPKAFFLEPVVISPEGVKRILPEPQLSVLDYHFYDDLVLLITYKYRKKKASLRLQDAEGELVLEKKLDFIPERLHKDCLGNLHLLSTDSAYQLYYDYESLRLLYAIPKGLFLSQVAPCRAFAHGKAYYQYSERIGLRQHYVSANRQGRNRFFSLADSSKINYLESEYPLRYFVELKRKRHPMFVNLTVSQINDRLAYYQEIINKDWLDNKVLSPLRAPIHPQGQDIVILDYLHHKVHRFDESDRLRASVPVSFDQLPNWTGEVFIDPVSSIPFVRLEKNGKTTLWELEPSSWKTRREIEISQHDFIKHIRIREGYIYFLDRDPGEKNMETYSLYRLKK